MNQQWRTQEAEIAQNRREMDPLKNPGRFRRFLGKYNNYLVWLYCGVFAVAELELIHKYYTGNAPKVDSTDIANEKEELMELAESIKARFKNFFDIKTPEDNDAPS